MFACIGPALEIFSRYARVETPGGTEKTLAEYLEKVWEVVGRVALEQVLGSPEAQARNGGAGALEEDARPTALFLWTVQATDDQTAGSGEDGEEETADEEDEEDTPGRKKPGFTLIYDVARRFALEQPEFRKALRQARREALSQTIGRLQYASSAAASTLLKVMLEAKTAPSSKIRASDSFLNHALRHGYLLAAIRDIVEAATSARSAWPLPIEF